jgi:hypothetical protein
MVLMSRRGVLSKHEPLFVVVPALLCRSVTHPQRQFLKKSHFFIVKIQLHDLLHINQNEQVVSISLAFCSFGGRCHM